MPIGDLLTRSIDDTRINYQLPLTFALIDTWDKKTLPDESLYEAVFRDLSSINKFEEQTLVYMSVYTIIWMH